jgi:hypothetical protein
LPGGNARIRHAQGRGIAIRDPFVYAVPRYFEWISYRATAKRRQQLTFSAPDGRSVSAPKGRQLLAVGDERSEEPTESIHKKTSPDKGGSEGRAWEMR